MSETVFDDDGNEILVDDYGQAVGYVTEAEDGAMILHDGAGGILAASTRDGQQLDPSEYAIDDDTGDPRVDELYAWAQQQDQLQAQQPVYQPEPGEIDWEELAEQRQDVERQLGRTLTVAEAQAAARNVTRQLDQGLLPNMAAALEGAWNTGDAKPIDLHNTEDQIDYATELLERSRDEANGREIGDPPARAADHYDVATHEGKTDAVLDILAGHDDVDTSMWDSRDAIE